MSHNVEVFPSVSESDPKKLRKGSKTIPSEKCVPANINTSNVSNSSATIKVTVSEKNIFSKDSQVKAESSDKVNKCNLVPNAVQDDMSARSEIVASDNKIKVKGETSSPSKISFANGAQSEMCKIHVRQPDGRLVPYFIPAHMYSVALKIAQMRSNPNSKNKVETEEISSEKVDVSKPSTSQTENTASNLLNDGLGCNIKIVKSSASLETSTKVPEGNTVAASSKSILNKKSMCKASESEPPSHTTIARIKDPVNVKDIKQSESHTIPIKILNLSPSKSQTKINPVVSVNSSVVSGSKKPGVPSQGKQTILRSTALSQQALLQLLSKVGVKDNVVLQQLLSNSGMKEGAVDIASLQKVQGQLISAQANQGAKCNVHLMPVKVLQDKLKPKLQGGKLSNIQSTATKILPQPIRPANIKLPVAAKDSISSKTISEGLGVSASLKPNAVIKPSSVSGTVLNIGDSKGTPVKILNDKSSIFMLPDGRIFKGSAKRLQVVSPQGNIMPQVNPVLVGNTLEKGKVVQISPLVVGNIGSNKVEVLQSRTALPSSSALTTTAGASVTGKKTELKSVKILSSSSLVSSVISSNDKTLVKPQVETSASKLTAASILSNPSKKVAGILPLKKDSMSVDVIKSEKMTPCLRVTGDSSKEEEINVQETWEKYTRYVCLIRCYLRYFQIFHNFMFFSTVLKSFSLD